MSGRTTGIADAIGLASVIGLAGVATCVLCLCASTASADTFRIEIDYMVETGVDPHTHRPTNDEVDAVIQMFACQGHTLIVDVDDALTHHDALRRDPADPNNFFNYDDVAASFKKIKDDHFDNAGGGWHYCIFAHQYLNADYDTTSSSGVAELGGDDLVVSLGAFTGETGTPFEKASTLAHEFGHNLGLGHCGTMYCGSNDLDPNYVGPRPLNLTSTMSYFYQLVGVRHNLECQGLVRPGGNLFKNIDYSHGRMCSINEANLSEPLGLMMIPVDWNCDGDVEDPTVSQDLNGSWDDFCAGTGQTTVLSDYDEWANISDAAKRKMPAELSNMEEITCVTRDEWDEFQKKADCGQAVLATEPCNSGEMMFVFPTGSPTGTGRCQDPVDSVADAHAVAPDGSILFLSGSTFSDGPQVLNRRIRIYSIDSAVIR